MHIFWVVRHHRGYYSELYELERNIGFLVLGLINNGIECDSHWKRVGVCRCWTVCNIFLNKIQFVKMFHIFQFISYFPNSFLGYQNIVPCILSLILLLVLLWAIFLTIDLMLFLLWLLLYIIWYLILWIYLLSGQSYSNIFVFLIIVWPSCWKIILKVEYNPVDLLDLLSLVFSNFLLFFICLFCICNSSSPWFK